METKRFIGSDLARIFARVRRDLGPDAVIIRTRSLLREGAEPLIEIVAAPGAAHEEVSLELQTALIEGALARLERTPVQTVGDLEDIAARETLDAGLPVPDPPPASPAWLQGFIADAPTGPAGSPDASDEPSGAMEAGRTVRFAPLPHPDEAPTPPQEWVRPPRPTIATQEPGQRESPVPPVVEIGRRFRPADPGIGPSLVAAGLSDVAADLIARSPHGTLEPHEALARYLGDSIARYPDEAHTALITIEGPAGTGRTTALMRMALDCADSGRDAILLAADGAHVGAREQVHAYGEAIGLEVIDAYQPAEIARALSRAKRGTCLFGDVPAGAWSMRLPDPARHFRYLALPSHWQREAVERALAGMEIEHAAGCVLTFTDITTDLTPVLSFAVEAGLGIAFLSSGRDVATGIGVADALTLASGMFTIRTGETTNGRLVATA